MSNKISQSGSTMAFASRNSPSAEPRSEMHPQWKWLAAIGLLSSAQTLVLQEETPAFSNEVA